MEEHLNDLKEIRKLMEKSSKFLSLSGLSGVFAGVVALLSAGVLYLKKVKSTGSSELNGFYIDRNSDADYLKFLFCLAIITLFLAISGGIFLTWRKTRKSKQNLWNTLSKKLALSLTIPLLVGGVFAMALVSNGMVRMVPGTTLVFYGLALINASQHTYRDVYYLGMFEVVIGVFALFIAGYSLLFWAFGFGVLHIAYGISMYFKYERIETDK
jgi:predicted lysophospholipase L1 biosynthesis ABC-type transport system permease subunit